jgi:hypothetical protein
MPNTLLSATVQSASAGLQGFDVNQPLTAAQAQDFKNAGYAFCIRYIPRTAALVANNLTNAEALDIMNAGLALMAVQHVALPGWQPTTNLGTQYGNFAAQYAQETVQLPPGLNVWCDLEGVAAATDPQDVIDYCQAWYYAVHAAGYVPGLYVGYHTRLTPEQLYNNTSFQHYWQDYNRSEEVATRGFQLIQQTEKTLNGVTFDPNVTQNDNLGDAVLWLSF